MKLLLLAPLLLFLCGCWPHTKQQHRAYKLQMPKGEDEIGPDEITFQFIPKDNDTDITSEWK